MNFFINLVYFLMDSLELIFLIGLAVFIVTKIKKIFSITSIWSVIKMGIKVALKALLLILKVLNKIVKVVYIVTNSIIAINTYNKRFGTHIKIADALKGSTFTSTGLKLTANGVFISHIPFKAKLVKFVAKISRLGIKNSIKGVYELYKRI